MARIKFEVTPGMVPVLITGTIKAYPEEFYINGSSEENVLELQEHFLNQLETLHPGSNILVR